MDDCDDHNNHLHPALSHNNHLNSPEERQLTHPEDVP